MKLGDLSSAKNGWLSRLALAALLIWVMASQAGLAAPQADSDIPPDATPQIQQVNPSQAAPGDHLTVIIQGSSFSVGAYVSSVSAAVRVEFSKRISATQIEAQLSVSASAPPSTVSLLVSNPASRAAETAFKIVAGQAPTAPVAPAAPAAPPAPSAPVAPAAPAAPPAPSAPVAPAAPAAPPAPSAPVAPAAPPALPAPSAPAAPAAPAGPQVTTIDPPHVGAGWEVDLKITGTNFVQGAKVSFANPGIRVVGGVTFVSSTALSVHIKVESGAAPGAASMFVINPGDHEVEVPFEVTGKGAAKPSTPPSPASPSTPGSTGTQRYDAFHLGNPAEIVQVHGKVKGSLVVSSDTIKYQEGGKTLINISLSEIKEIKVSSLATATFHITLNSGKTFHFAPGSLRPSDARKTVDALRQALPH